MFVYRFSIRLTSKHLRRLDRRVDRTESMRICCGFPSLPLSQINDFSSFLLTLSSNDGDMNMEQCCFVMPPRCFAAAFLTDAGSGDEGRLRGHRKGWSGSGGCTAVGTVANVEREREREREKEKERQQDERESEPAASCRRLSA